MPADNPQKLTKNPRGSLKKWLFTILLVLLGTGSWIYLQPKKNVAVTEPKILNIKIGSAQLRIPENLVRDQEHKINGNLNAINLAANWPDFSPVNAPNNLINTTETQNPKIFIMIEPADDTIAPEQRPSSLYSRFLTTDISDNQNQLITRIFKAGSPYSGEVLHIAPPNGDVFAARCQLIKPPEARPEHCLWQIRMYKLDISVRFPSELLVQWETLNSTLRTVLQNIIIESK